PSLLSLRFRDPFGAGGEESSLELQLVRQGMVDRAPSILDLGSEKARFAETVIAPAGIVQYRIEADALDRHALSDAGPHLPGHVVDPGGAGRALSRGF